MLAGGATPDVRCGTCHPKETQRYSLTRMAHAAMPVLESEFAQYLPRQALREPNGGFLFTFERNSTGISMTAAQGERRAEGQMRWVLGAGAQGQTPLVETTQGIAESRISYFPQLRQYGITIGQDGGVSPNSVAALGLHKSNEDAHDCVTCHASITGVQLETIVPGVACQRCHPGADQHALGRGKPLNPGKLDARAQVELCATCHRIRPPESETSVENVRFQPLRLVKSRCFASAKLACTTCHVAHEDARRADPAYYNAKCQTCHGELNAHADQRKNGDCIGCHMPKVQLHPALTFTDHFIRIVNTRN
jgi:hypothetical protein